MDQQLHQGPRCGSTTCSSQGSQLPCTIVSTADGLATPRRESGPGSREMCPFCGERTVRAEVSSSAGKRAVSMCCGIPQEFIDHYDVFTGLPEPLQQVAIDRRKAEYAAMDERDREDARRFRESLAVWHAKYDRTGLIKGD